MIKINKPDGKLFRVFHDEAEAVKEIRYIYNDGLDGFKLDGLPFNELLEFMDYHITKDTVNCQVCHNELDDDFDDELLIGYRCSYCRENPEMGKYKL